MYHCTFWCTEEQMKEIEALAELYATSKSCVLRAILTSTIDGTSLYKEIEKEVEKDD